jgi:hypothetical protein
VRARHAVTKFTLRDAGTRAQLECRTKKTKNELKQEQHEQQGAIIAASSRRSKASISQVPASQIH